MNRQAIPSMFLSVLIVCAFAVVLFERDPDAAGRRPDRDPVAEKNSEARAPTSASPMKDESSRPENSKVPGEQLPRRAPEQSTEPIGLRPVSKEPKPIAAPATTPAASAAVQGEPRSPDSDEPNTVRPPAASPATPDAPPASPAVPVSTGPRSAFIVVQSGETLKDVAVRVYGSADRLDVLWRANRDVLPRSDSPLSPGAVLRTPDE
jgi:nucleoid-associated protein YgaU